MNRTVPGTWRAEAQVLSVSCVDDVVLFFQNLILFSFDLERGSCSDADATSSVRPTANVFTTLCLQSVGAAGQEMSYRRSDHS